MTVENTLIFAVLISSCIVTSSFVLRRIMCSILLWRKKQASVSKIFDRFFILTIILSIAFYSLLFLFNQESNMVDENFFDEIQENGWVEILVNNPVSACFFLGCVIAIIYCIDSCDTYLVHSQSENINIGVMWAYSAFNAYFQVLFREWSEYTRKYLQSGNQLDCMKLILICPLSCNIDSALHERYDRIFEQGYLTDDIENDQGANINRLYKIPVYRVGNEKNSFSLIAQFPSSLGTLWQVKESMPLHKWLYHRDSFISTLKKLLKDCPCTILEYDDTVESSQEPLDKFLIHKLNLRC
nr:uncharacterized protein LOC107439471 isoform X1 [Parasteatoda tepidariorum]